MNKATGYAFTRRGVLIFTAESTSILRTDRRGRWHRFCIWFARRRP